MFSISCFEGSTCLANTVIGTVITFKFVNTCGCVFFMFGVVCDQDGQNNNIPFLFLFFNEMRDSKGFLPF